jgi:hypothetical protein
MADQWDRFDDLLEQGEMPVFGFRVLVRIAADGTEHVDFAWTGDEVRNYLAVGALEAAKIELFHRGLHEADGSDT